MEPHCSPCLRMRKRKERLHRGAREANVDRTWDTSLTGIEATVRPVTCQSPQYDSRAGVTGGLQPRRGLRGRRQLPTAADDRFEVVVCLIDRQTEAELRPAGRPRLGPDHAAQAG